MEPPTPPVDTDVIKSLAELPEATIVSEEALRRIFGKGAVSSIKRAVERGELPQPVRLFGKPSWTVRVLIQHIEERLEKASKDARRVQLKLAKHHA